MAWEREHEVPLPHSFFLKAFLSLSIPGAKFPRGRLSWQPEPMTEQKPVPLKAGEAAEGLSERFQQVSVMHLLELLSPLMWICFCAVNK